MLGLADRARIIDLFESIMRGDIAAALAELRSQYETGADPAVVLSDLAEFTHFVTRVKIVPSVGDDPAFIETERSRGRVLAERLSMRVLSRTWQMLLKGIAEVNAAGRPLAAAEMILIRIAYAADLPTPDEVIRSLNGKDTQQRQQSGPAAATDRNSFSTPASQAQPAKEGAGSAVAARAAPAAEAGAERKPEPLVCQRLEDLIALAAAKRDIGVKLALERDVRLVRCEDGRLEVALEPGAAKSLINDLARKFSQWSNRPWIVVVSAEQGEPTIRSQNDARKAELKTGVRSDPLVQAVLARFPGAEIVDVRKAETVGSGNGETPASQPPPSVDGEEIEPEPEEESSAFGVRSAKMAGYEDL
jgi:DNA polymerase-3 subunit gamma/tau